MVRHYSDAGHGWFGRSDRGRSVWPDSDRPLYPSDSPIRQWSPGMMESPLEDRMSYLNAKDPLADQAAAPKDGCPGWTVDYATAYLVHMLQHPSDDMKAALQHDCSRRIGLPNFAAWMFHHLDAAFFDGRLSGNVSLKLSNRDPSWAGSTHNPGKIAKRVTVHLSARAFDECDEYAPIPPSMLHQMIHAYFLLHCGAMAEDTQIDGRVAHGRHFQAVLEEIFKAEGRRPNGDRVYGHLDFQTLPYRLREYYYPQDRSHYEFSFDDGRLPHEGRTRCGWHYEPNVRRDWLQQLLQDQKHVWESPHGQDVYVIGEDGQDTHMHRSQAGLPGDYVELIWDGKPFQVPRKALEKLPSLQQHFENGNRALEIPTSDREMFQTLYDFVQNGDYKPDVAAVQDGGKGPPKLADYQPDWPQYIKRDIEVFKFASLIDFKELQNKALSRMNSHHVTHSDPMEMLYTVYLDSCNLNSKLLQDDAIHPALRDWAKNFYLQHTDPHPTFQYETSNLNNLLQAPWNTFFNHFWRKGGAIKQDIDIVRNMFRQPPLSSQPPPPTPGFESVHPHTPHPHHPVGHHPECRCSACAHRNTFASHSHNYGHPHVHTVPPTPFMSPREPTNVHPGHFAHDSSQGHGWHAGARNHHKGCGCGFPHP